MINPADTAFVLLCAALVLFMTPGLAFFYGGLVRGKNVVNTMLMSLLAMGLVGVQWVLWGYSLSFSPGGRLTAFIGGLSWLGLRGVGAWPQADLAPGIPHQAFMLFQAMFAVITPALISGAVVERMKIKTYLVFVLVWSTLVYAPVAHWVWAPGGWLRALGVLDFAGGTVVHINAGVAALVAALVLGPRKGFGKSPMLPHNVPFALLGMGMLWFGWLGFNGGSALAANGVAATAFSTTFIAAAAGCLVWALLELWIHDKATGVGVASGAVAGLVAITPASGYVSSLGALAIGAGAAGISYLAVSMRPKLGVDDSLDVFGVHGLSGLWGALATGLFAQKAVNPDGADGLFAGNGHLLLIQAVAALATVAYSAATSFAILKVLSLAMGLRVDKEVEEEGLDIAENGEHAYGLESGRPAPHPESPNPALAVAEALRKPTDSMA